MPDGGGLIYQASTIMDILERLESYNEYCQPAESKQVMKDAAAEIRELRHKAQQLEALIQRRASKSMARGVMA